MEVLVVIVVIGIVASLSVVAVSLMRAHSQRLACQNNMRQIGLAMAEHHAQKGSFLAVDPILPCRGQKYPTAFVHWMPYLEQAALYEAWPTCRSGESVQFVTISRPTPSVLICPAASPPSAPRTNTRPAISSAATGLNYRLCFGETLGLLETPSPSRNLPARNGVFGWGRPATAAQITDGLSFTVGLSEKRQGSWDRSSFDPDRDTWSLRDGLGGDRERTRQVCAAPPTRPLNFFTVGGGAWYTTMANDVFYNHVSGPNSAGSDCTTVAANVGLFRATSDHRGGVNTLRMDGAVHFASNAIDLRLWRALATCAGDEVASWP